MTEPTNAAPAALTNAVATAPKKVSAVVAAANARREIVKQIRGTQWGQDCSAEVANAVARWSLDNGVDAVRHVEVLGGRIYLNGDFYLEKAAPFVMAGELRYEEPQFVHADPGLIEMANRDREKAPEWERAQIDWARAESFRRFQVRVERGIPHDATGACIFIVHTKSGTPVVGVNWCGGASKIKTKRDGSKYRSDPIGDAEPTKTAQTRAARRALRQIIEAFPDSGLARAVKSIEANAKLASQEIEAIIETEPKAPAHPAGLAAVGDGYGEDGEPKTLPAPAPIDEAARLEAIANERRQAPPTEAGRTKEDEDFELGLDGR